MSRVCPSCKKTPSFASVLAAMSPMSINCSHCGHKIKLDMKLSIPIVLCAIGSIFMVWWTVVNVIGANLYLAYTCVFLLWVGVLYGIHRAVVEGSFKSELVEPDSADE